MHAMRAGPPKACLGLGVGFWDALARLAQVMGGDVGALAVAAKQAGRAAESRTGLDPEQKVALAHALDKWQGERADRCRVRATQRFA